MTSFRVTVTDEAGTVVESFHCKDFDDEVLADTPMEQARAALHAASDLARIGSNGQD